MVFYYVDVNQCTKLDTTDVHKPDTDVPLFIGLAMYIDRLQTQR